jgi:LPS-assembly protein
MHRDSDDSPPKPCRRPGDYRVGRLLWVMLVMMSAICLADDAAVTASDTTSLATLSADAWRILGWKTKEELTPAQQATLPTGCCGTFIQPTPSTPQTSNPTATSASGDSILVSGVHSESTEQSTVMTGDVVLTQGERRISGDHAELFNQPQGANLTGNVLFQEPGFLLQGSDMKLDMEENSLKIQNAHYVLPEQHIHGTAKEIQRNAKGVITLTDSTYSSCTPGDELWFLKSSSMEIDPTQGIGKASNVRIEVLDTPVFYIPYMEFPVGGERHSGFLMPSFASGKNGLDISLPYYFNLAPNYDATVIPRLIEQRGTQLGGELRYLSPLFTASSTATWLSNDQQTGDNRWLLALKQTGGMQHPWSTLVDYTRVSDKNYFTDLDNIGLSVSRATSLTERANAGYMTERWDNTVDLVSYQSLLTGEQPDFYEKLPEIRTAGDYYLGHGFSTQLSQSVAHFNSFDPAQASGDRLAADYQLGWRSDWQAGYIAPGLELHYLQQQLDSLAAESQPQVTIPAAKLDMGMTFEHDDALDRQTLEPRLHYRYAAYKNQDAFQLFDTDEMTFGYSQLFQDNRFSGSDRIGDANQLATGVTSRWINQASGNEWLQVGVGQVFYHADRKVTAYTPAIYTLLPASYQNQYTNQQSPLLGGLQWAFMPHWHLSSELAWDEELHHTHDGNIFLHYQGDDHTLFSVGYRYVQLLQWTGSTYVPDTARQADLSAYWPFNPQWAIIGRTFYDFTNQRFLEGLAGFQYEDCCWRFRTFFRHWATNPDNVLALAQQKMDTGIFFEFQFKNLAGMGTKTSGMLKDSIYGYSETRHEQNE